MKFWLVPVLVIFFVIDSNGNEWKGPYGPGQYGPYLVPVNISERNDLAESPRDAKWPSGCYDCFFSGQICCKFDNVRKAVKIRKIVQLMLIKMVFQLRSQEMIAMIADLLERFVVNMVTVQNAVNMQKIVQLMAEILE